jgi:arylsulfatase A-like enzyme
VAVGLVALAMLVGGVAPPVARGDDGGSADADADAGADADTDVAAPRLVVVIVIDQMRGDTLERFAGTLAEDGGFARLSRAAAVYTDCTYAHAVTSTGPGHATILTGANPSAHGIVGNRWYDRERGATVYCVEAPGGGARALGPGRLAAETLGDALDRETGGRARVVSVSWKDRAAILLGGRRADRVAWFDRTAGGFATAGLVSGASDAIAQAGALVRAQHGRVWALLYPEERYPEADDRPWERGPRGVGRTFPHAVDGGLEEPGPAFYDAVPLTPFADEAVLALARALVVEQGLGQDEVPDLLAVSLSASDYVGHWFGPMSRESRDLYARLDGQLAAFLEFLDARVGLDRAVIALTSDHGGTPIVESQAGGGDAGPSGRISYVRLMRVAADAAAAALGWPKDTPREKVRALVQAFHAPHLYLAEPARAPEVCRAVARAVSGLEGVTAWSAAALAEPTEPTEPAEPGAGAGSAPAGAGEGAAAPAREAARLSLHAERSGDVVCWPDARHCWVPGEPAYHGRFTREDMHVPLLIRAPGVSPGQRTAPCHVRDLAPTLAKLLGIPAPRQATGRPLPGLAPR